MSCTAHPSRSWLHPKLYLHLFFFFCLAIFFTTQTAQANHFRSGFMSWESVDGEANTVLIKVEVGWTNDHGQIPTDTAVGEVVEGAVNLQFGDGSSHSGDVRVTSRNTTTNDVQTELVSIKDGDDAYTSGVEHTYASSGDYVAYWGASARESAQNQDGSAWRNETKINIGGEYEGNNSPITAVASVVQVPDNQEFSFDLTAVDTDGDDVEFRYGTQDEFYNNGNDTTATKPTGLQLGSDGSVTWDVRDTELATEIGDRWQMTVMAEDLDSEGNVKSYVPLDFVLLISDSSDTPPTLTANQDSHATEVGETLDFTLEAVDPDWESGDSSPTISAINPPSSDTDIWSTTASSTNATTTTEVSFAPSPDMNGDSFVIVFQATDAGGNATTKSITINVANDTDAPVISDVSLALEGTSATAAWSTGEAGSSRVVYGPTDAYGASTTEINTDTRVTDHSVALPDLASCTVYHYAVVSRDAVGNTATSSDSTFTTDGCDGGATPSAPKSTVITSSATGTASSTVGGRSLQVDTPANVTSTSSSFAIQIFALDSTQTLGSVGSVGRLDGVGDTIFDVKAIIDGTTILDSFDAPVTITYTYADADVAEFKEPTLSLYHYHDGSWGELDDCALDQDANTLTCTTDNFSLFAPFGTKVADSGRTSGTLFGCKDPEAENYHRFSSHKQELCEYADEASDTTEDDIEGEGEGGTTEALQERIAELRAQIATLEEKTGAQSDPDGAACPFTRHLERGMQGEDVRCLQRALNTLGFTLAESGPGAPGEETVYFSGLTFDALRRYQEANAERVLTPIGLSAPTGYFGSQSTAALKEDNPLHQEEAADSESPLFDE